MSNGFGKNNPNHDIFIVETEEGPDSEDNMCSMIGDATMAHLAQLSPAQRQVWEHYYLGGKDLFFFAPSSAENDKDPHDLKAEDLENYFDNHPVDEKAKVWLEEAIEVEKERRAKSEDVYDKANELIPYQDWQDNPGLFKHFDIPTTPKNLAIYAGSTTQNFYDEFPEGHPDSKVINALLVKVNRDQDDLTDKYGIWLKEWLDKQPVQFPYVTAVLERLITRLVEGEKDPEELCKIALQLIDDDWRKQYIQTAQEKLKNDPVHQLLVHKSNEWDSEYERGVNVLPMVKSFGQTLYSKFRGQIKRSHWSKYKALKAKYSGAVIIKGLDVNSCRLGDLERKLRIPRNIAVAIYTSRPFSGPNELLKRETTITQHVVEGGKLVEKKETVIKGWLDPNAFQERGNIEQIYTLIDTRAEQALASNNKKIFSALSGELVARQKENKENFSSKEWGSVWTYYRSKKSDILNPRATNNE